MVVFPTESSYGLAVAPFSVQAVARLMVLKGERGDKQAKHVRERLPDESGE